MSARVVALHLHERHGEHPRAVSEVDAVVGAGIVGDSHGNRERRAVLVIDRSTLDAHGLSFGDLREQITIDGLPDVTRLRPETELSVGAVTLRVTGECEPCTHIGEMNGQADVEAFRVSLEHRRGALCSVVAVDGPIRIGDPVSVLVRA